MRISARVVNSAIGGDTILPVSYLTYLECSIFQLERIVVYKRARQSASGKKAYLFARHPYDEI